MRESYNIPLEKLSDSHYTINRSFQMNPNKLLQKAKVTYWMLSSEQGNFFVETREVSKKARTELSKYQDLRCRIQIEFLKSLP